MTEMIEKRRHPRCGVDREILFSYGSHAELLHGLARNCSRYSLYFESTTALAPGTLLFVRMTGGGSIESADKGKSMEAAVAASEVRDTANTACRELKTTVVAQVRRCVEIADSEKTIYGTGAEYVSPAV